MKQHWRTGLLLLAIAAFITPAHADDVRIAVAANFLATLKEIKPDYEVQTGDRLIISATSSGKLYAQIINGAPFDVFLSADQSYPEKLEHAGSVVQGSRFVYARGQLVLWGRNPAEPLTADALKQEGGLRIAIANPRTAPYGRAAQQVLDHLGKEVTQGIEIVQGESIAQAFQFAATGNVALGFVALSQVLSDGNTFNKENYWFVPNGFYDPLQQGAALLMHGRDNQGARRFLQFLRSEPARRVIKKYGYQ